MTDLLLAATHHVFALGLFGLLAMEYAALNPPLLDLNRVLRLDALYGVSALLMLSVGFARVIWGSKGAGFYLSNPWFWAKMCAFALTALISLTPTFTFLSWRRARRKQTDFQPKPQSVRLQRRLVAIELVVLLGVGGCAAAMARFGAF
jgi:putative membrane protein